MQYKFSFDKESLIKIGKGALIAFTGAGAIAMLEFIGTINIDNVMLTSFVAWLVPVGINAIKEWKKGA